jgi:hypothetical protein
MPQVYNALTPAERQRAQIEYLKFLKGRDGTPDPANRRLSVREEYFRQIDSHAVYSQRKVDKAAFERNHRAAEPETNLDPLMLWLLCTAKLNQSERYGVELEIAHNRRQTAQVNPDDAQSYIVLEEFYHTRILLDVLKVFGLEIEMLPPPDRRTRWLIHGMVYVPKKFSLPLTLVGEVFGVVAFSLLRNKASELFADEPEVLARVQSLYDEILADEIGHVMFARAQLGKIGLKVAQTLQPLVVKSILDNVPELTQLFGAAEVKRAIAEVDHLLAGEPSASVKPFSYRPVTTTV